MIYSKNATTDEAPKVRLNQSRMSFKLSDFFSSPANCHVYFGDILTQESDRKRKTIFFAFQTTAETTAIGIICLTSRIGLGYFSLHSSRVREKIKTKKTGTISREFVYFREPVFEGLGRWA